jgi:hypothetical protein
VDPVVEVLAKGALVDRALEVAVGRRDEADVEPDLALAADRPDLALLEGAQELRLERERQLADLVAPVNAPFTCPNSSLSSSASGIAAQFTVTSLAARRRLRSWIARATSSLPVPLSPVISTEASVSATRSTRSNTSRIAALSPISAPPRPTATRARSRATSRVSARCRTARSAASTSTSSWNGLVTKS